ncbi:hypothetical protein F5884DRAFT_789570 [Xylogone sp. PMI_703]|nr:hypothetical protein F5884DRAFT_789570 [Xylogone sp. PMI_703]
MPVDHGRTATRSQQACTSCRQVKLRCDRQLTFPAACSRCKKNNLECRVDSTFKRVRTRNRLNELTNQLNAIQRNLNLQQAASTFEVNSTDSSPSTQARSPSAARITDSNIVIPEYKDNSESLDKKFYRFSETKDAVVFPVTLGQVSLNIEQVGELFKQFEVYHYQHCPILDTNRDIADLYHSSPFLFWTIVIISCQRHTSLKSLYPLLVGSYRTLLGSVLVGSIESLDVLQAIILLCFWPLFVRRQGHDPTWNYCGLITNAALHMRLHSYANGSFDSISKCSEKESRIRAITWMACVQIHSLCAWHNGLALFSELTKSPKPLATPLYQYELEFEARTMLHQRLLKSALIMIGITRSSDSFQTTKALVDDLDYVKDRYRHVWSTASDIMLLTAQIKVCAYQLQVHDPSSRDLHNIHTGHPLDHSTYGLQQLGFMASIRLIYAYSEASYIDNNEENSPDLSSSDQGIIPQRCLPKGCFLGLWLAVAFVFKILAVRGKSISSSDRQLAMNHIQIAYEIMSRISTQPGDEAHRAARVVGILSRTHDLSLLARSGHDVDITGVNLMQDVTDAAGEIAGTYGQTVGSRTTDLIDPGAAPATSNTFHESQSENSHADFDFNIEYNLDWNMLLSLGEGGYIPNYEIEGGS